MRQAAEISDAATLKDLTRLEKWYNNNLTPFKRGKYKVLHLGRKNTRHW